MTHTLHTPPQRQHRQPLRPFAGLPQRWEEERSRALDTGHIYRETVCTISCEPVLVHERTGWGWLTWTVPADGSLPERPHRVGVLPPGATLTQRLAVRWLTRRPAHHIALTTASHASVRLSTAAVAAVSLFAALLAMSLGVAADVVLPAALLAPLLTEHLPGRLDHRAYGHVRSVEDGAASHYLHRLASLHTHLVQAAADNDHHELHRSAEIGQNLLWDAAGLLQSTDTRSVSAELIDRERLMVRLADHADQALKRTRTQACSHAADAPSRPARPLGPYPPGTARPARPGPRRPPSTAPLKGYRPMPQPQTDNADPTADVYLLFAHEPYYPGPGSREVNTTVVAAGSLLHRRVRQPDGARIHALLTHRRPAGEIVPLATLTHELDGGDGWPRVGDWQRVTTDLVRLVRTDGCDALSLGLPDIARALMCTGPHGHVRTLNPASGERVDHGPTQRDEVLTQIDAVLTSLVAERDLWPGDNLLPALTDDGAR
ncbi:hypothetical protein ACKI16_30075 [Streptomyces scabiei]|uniref:Uncharacterized protein n=1 Tax=Streptomyces scabiei TaxID=1930 RepID=A0A117EFB4_STRSC|nr:hypothetical protein [Streptomyces scabiei]GAQ65438.1 hypothetical protein SsS58_05847 [Streptomyces scabiei]